MHAAVHTSPTTRVAVPLTSHALRLSRRPINPLLFSFFFLPVCALCPSSRYSFFLRKDNTARIFLHTTLSAITAFCFYRHAPEACNAAASRATTAVQNCIARTQPIAKDLFAMACLTGP